MIVINKVDGFWRVEVNGVEISKAKGLVKVCKSLVGFVKGHPELEK